MKIFESRTHNSAVQRPNVVSMNTRTQTIHSIYQQGLDTNTSSTQIIQLNYKHVLDKHERIEYIDNTLNIRTNTINLHWDWSNRYYLT